MKSIFQFTGAFIFSTLACMLALAFMMLILEGFVGPLLSWIFLDRWEWSPIGAWVCTSILGAAVGAVANVFFTNYTWLLKTRATLLRRSVVTALVIGGSIFAIVMVREYVGQFLPDEGRYANQTGPDKDLVFYTNARAQQKSETIRQIMFMHVEQADNGK